MKNTRNYDLFYIFSDQNTLYVKYSNEYSLLLLNYVKCILNTIINNLLKFILI